MDYSRLLGQNVVREDGVDGKLTEFNNGQFVFDFSGEAFSPTYMFDPFMAEIVKFKDATIQKEIDNILANVKRETEQMIAEKNSTKNPKYMLAKHDYFTDEQIILYKLDCTEEEFRLIANYEIRKYQKLMKNTPEKYVPCVFKGYDIISNEQIFQETFHPICK